jgi:hypothetical protein
VFPEHVLAQVLALLPLADVLAVRCVCRWFADVVDYNWAGVVVPLCVCHPTSAIFYGYLDEGCVPGLTRALGRLGFREQAPAGLLPLWLERGVLQGHTAAVLFLCDHFGVARAQLPLRPLLCRLYHAVQAHHQVGCLEHAPEERERWACWNPASLDAVRALLLHFHCGLDLGLDADMSDNQLLLAMEKLHVNTQFALS